MSSLSKNYLAMGFVALAKLLHNQAMSWIISQRWEHVAFLHYEADPLELQKLVPFPLDLFEGKAIVSIVPFVMSQIRFPYLPPVPGLSRLLELNLRTYVTLGGKRAVYFSPSTLIIFPVFLSRAGSLAFPIGRELFRFHWVNIMNSAPRILFFRER